MLKFSPMAMRKISDLYDMAQNDSTLCALFEKLDGCNAAEAYSTLKSMSDHEVRLLAALISQANRKFNRLQKEA